MKRYWFYAAGAAFIISLAAHSFFIYEWSQGRYMAGPQDGLNQVAPFKHLLYQQWASGSFFYSDALGMGAGIYSQLGYYYSTNIFFYATAAVVWTGETLGWIAEPDTLFWIRNMVWISVIRLTLMIITAFAFFRYISLPGVHAFFAAVLYGVSVIYFRHTFQWEFFSDAVLLVPLLSFGAEKIIREGKPGFWILAVALSVFQNFYFAYINLLLVALYFCIRWFIPLTKKELQKKKQLFLFGIGTLLGFGAGAVGFIPAVYAFLQNYRPPYEEPAALLSFSDNVLFNSQTVILPLIFVFIMFLFPLYKDPFFRVFAIFSIILLLFHHSPLAGSIMNGFSAPRQRFGYWIYWSAGITTARALMVMRPLAYKSYLTAGSLTVLLYVLYYVTDDSLPQVEEGDFLYLLPILFLFLLFISAGMGWYAWKQSKAALYSIMAVFMVVSLVVVNVFQYIEVTTGNVTTDVSEEFITGEEYDSPEQRSLVDAVDAQDEEFHRVDWRKVLDRNNIPLWMDFNGLSAFSSILNDDLLFFYYEDLEIDMKEESVSRYGGLGDRANLHALLQGDYVIREKEDRAPVPYGFKPLLESEHYLVFENRFSLPFVQISDQLFTEEQLGRFDPVTRERAMLQGIVTAEGDASADPEELEAESLWEQSEIIEKGAEYEEGTLTVTEEEGGMDVEIEDAPDSGDLYVSFFLHHNASDAPPFSLQVNDFTTERKGRESLYRTEEDRLTIRVPAAETVSIRLPEGSYTLEQLDIRHENYELLEEKTETQVDSSFVWEDDYLEVQVDDASAGEKAVLPVPYEKGWSVTVNGEPGDIEKLNYAFLGTTLKEGENTVIFTYRPPFWRFSLGLFIVSTVLSWIWIGVRRKKAS